MACDSSLSAAPAATSAVRVWAFDEARFGLKTWFRRRWCPRGWRAPWVVEDRYEWLWLYAAVEPATGASFCLYLPRLDGDCLEAFLQAFRQTHPEDHIVLVLDGSGSHGNGTVTWPVGIHPLRLPPYSPELNPAERWFEDLRGALANTLFESIDALMAALTQELEPYWAQPTRLARLTSYPWWLEGIANIRTSI